MARDQWEPVEVDERWPERVAFGESTTWIWKEALRWTPPPP
jgi:hypothetical protein